MFLATPFFLPNPRRLTSATPIRGISRLRRGPFGTLGQILLFRRFLSVRLSLLLGTAVEDFFFSDKLIL